VSGRSPNSDLPPRPKEKQLSDNAVVTAMLGAAGLNVPADEIAELAAGYAGLRASLESLYGPAFADADPYLVPGIPSDLMLS
jgi:hypothetical protein